MRFYSDGDADLVVRQNLPGLCYRQFLTRGIYSAGAVAASRPAATAA